MTHRIQLHHSVHVHPQGADNVVDPATHFHLGTDLGHRRVTVWSHWITVLSHCGLGLPGAVFGDQYFDICFDNLAKKSSLNLAAEMEILAYRIIPNL